MLIEEDTPQYTIVRAMNIVNAKKQLCEKYEYCGSSDYLSNYVTIGEVEEFDNKKEAEKYINLKESK